MQLLEATTGNTLNRASGSKIRKIKAKIIHPIEKTSTRLREITFLTVERREVRIDNRSTKGLTPQRKKTPLRTTNQKILTIIKS